jgi:hypothetical protein
MEEWGSLPLLFSTFILERVAGGSSGSCLFCFIIFLSPDSQVTIKLQMGASPVLGDLTTLLLLLDG